MSIKTAYKTYSKPNSVQAHTKNILKRRINHQMNQLVQGPLQLTLASLLAASFAVVAPSLPVLYWFETRHLSFPSCLVSSVGAQTTGKNLDVFPMYTSVLLQTHI